MPRADVKVAAGAGANDVYTMVRGLQRQLHLQRSALDAVHVQARESELKLRQATAALMTAQEVERKRIASELHDSVGSALNALTFAVGGALALTSKGDSQGTANLLQRAAQQVKGILDDVRRIAMDLRPAILDDLGIVGTLTWFSREFLAVYPHVMLRTQIEVQEADVAEPLRTPIFRVTQEALNNIIKYANATEVLVRLARGQTGIVLEIKDNGDGFVLRGSDGREQTGATGLGLCSMRDRVEFSGGEFHVCSAPGRGTQIVASWALPSACA